MQKNLLHINIQQNKIEIIFLHFCLHNTENLVLTNTDIVFRSVKIYGKSMKFTKFRISNSALLLRHCAGSPRDPRNLPRSMEVSGNFKRVQFTFQRKGRVNPYSLLPAIYSQTQSPGTALTRIVSFPHPFVFRTNVFTLNGYFLHKNVFEGREKLNPYQK